MKKNQKENNEKSQYINNKEINAIKKFLII